MVLMGLGFISDVGGFAELGRTPHSRMAHGEVCIGYQNVICWFT